jgi:hypothetical protein
MNTTERNTASGTAVPVGQSGPCRGNRGRAARPHLTVAQTLWVAAAAAIAAIGVVAMPAATAIADDSDLPPGAPIIRDAPRGIVNANSEVRWAEPGAAYSDGSDASAGAPILIHHGNQSPLCFANGEFSPFTEDC